MRRVWLLATLLSMIVFVSSWVAIHHGWFTRDQLIDTHNYEVYGDRVRSGEVPYRDFSVEYPPVSFVAFVVPTFFHSLDNSRGYQHWFEVTMLLCGLALVACVALGLARIEPRVEHALPGLLLVAFAPLLIGSVILTRFDLWPTLLVAAAVAALLWERDTTAAVLLGLAVSAKLWPAVLIPVVLAWEWRRRGRRFALERTGVTALVIVLCFGPFAILSPGGTAHSLTTQLSRPLQVESLGSSILMALHNAFGLGIHFASSHGSQNLEGGLPNAVAAASTGLGLVALLAVWLLFARGPAEPDRLVAACAAAVVVFIGFGKVFSPQFVIWLLALVPLVRGVVARTLLVVVFVLTQTWFPHRYWPLALTAAEPQAWFLLARDLAVVALGVFLLLRLQDYVLGEDRALVEPRQPVRRQVEARAP